MSVISATHHRAQSRLPHPCYACGLPILGGDEWIETRELVDGHVSTRWEHEPCTRALRPGIVGTHEDGLMGLYLIHYFDPTSDTEPAWRDWYQRRVRLLAQDKLSTHSHKL